MDLINEIYKEFKIKTLQEIIKEFPIYNEEEHRFNDNYMYDGDFYKEEWRQIPNFNYEISNYGRIKNIVTGKLKKLKYQAYGMQVILWKDSKGYTMTISKLVYIFFNKPLKKNQRVYHKDKNIRNNYYKNLGVI